MNEQQIEKFMQAMAEVEVQKIMSLKIMAAALKLENDTKRSCDHRYSDGTISSTEHWFCTICRGNLPPEDLD